MNSIDKWTNLGDKIDFSISLYYGGGLGDLIHRLYDSYYLRTLRHIKIIFPNLKINLLIDTSRNMESAKALFETNPYIDNIFIWQQKFTNQDIYAMVSNVIGDRKGEFNRFMPEMDNETVFLRMINRIYELTAFPRLRTITMDDFFQQMALRIEDFEMDEPKIYLKPDEKEYGKKLVSDLKANGNKVVAVHFFSGQETKMIKPQAAKDIVRWLIADGYKVVIMGTKQEAEPELHNGDKKDMVLMLKGFRGHPDVTYLCDDTGIRHKVSVIANCDYMVCNDSGLMHAAWFYRVKTVSLLNPDTFDRFQKKGGYYWAITDKASHTSYVLFNRDSRLVDVKLIEQRMVNFDEKEKEEAAKKTSEER